MIAGWLGFAGPARAQYTCTQARPAGPVFSRADLADSGRGLVVTAVDDTARSWFGVIDGASLAGALTPRPELIPAVAVAAGDGVAMLLGAPQGRASAIQPVDPVTGVASSAIELASLTGAVGQVTNAAIAYREGSFLVVHDAWFPSGEVAIHLARVTPRGGLEEAMQLGLEPAPELPIARAVAIAVGGDLTYVAWQAGDVTRVVRFDAAGAPTDVQAVGWPWIVADEDGILLVFQPLSAAPTDPLELRRVDADGVVTQSWSLTRPAGAGYARAARAFGALGFVWDVDGMAWLYTFAPGETAPSMTSLGAATQVVAADGTGALYVVGLNEARAAGYESWVTLGAKRDREATLETKELARIEGELDYCDRGCTATPAGRAPRAGAVVVVLCLLLGGAARRRR